MTPERNIVLYGTGQNVGGQTVIHPQSEKPGRITLAELGRDKNISIQKKTNLLWDTGIMRHIFRRSLLCNFR